ncbi:Peptidase C39 family protein [Parapedobacter luteus]|uniref:Peptidase C39 family protein n=1 Tax=Parapedobacter luteus TaxID=623280 RepID=A0A1T4ZXJ8_9SPHI|nr:vitamin K epoxide reductase family protein [Parapedobacter luteus]SKB27450.1 Peptidase C39 family protein [Parapedobacter luteus]
MASFHQYSLTRAPNHNKRDGLSPVCQFLLNFFNIRFTNSQLSDFLNNHLESPSLLTIKDTLAEYGIDNAAIKKADYSYTDFETPFVCVIQRKDWNQARFTVVTTVDQGMISYLNPVDNKFVSIPLAEFEKMDKELILFMDGSNDRDEKNYQKNRQQEAINGIINQIPIYLLGVSLTITVLYLFSAANLTPQLYYVHIGYLLTSILSIGCAILPLLHDVDSHNPFVQEICGTGNKQVNCTAVLTSKGSSFLHISWSIWGFTYFTAFFLSMSLFANQSLIYVSIWPVLSFIVSPYVIYSLYYQKLVVKQWCPLCLAVQAPLFLNLFLATFHLTKNNTLAFGVEGWYALFTVIFLGLSILMAAYWAIPLIKRRNDSKNYKKRWKKLLLHPDTFQVLLSKSNPITESVIDIGIVIGNPNARNEIIKVCNPYCGPCSKAHSELEHLINRNADVRLRTIFSASGADDDKRTAPAAHLLAIQQKYGEAIVRQSLDEWYLTPKKKYASFAKKYPMNGELKEQKGKIEEMRNWCDTMKIRVTPPLFINGRELPKHCRVTNLKSFL